MQTAALKTLITARLRARRETEREQRQLLNPVEDFAETIIGKLTGYLDTPQFYNFSKCGQEDIYRTCKDCGRWEAFPYKCNIKWCPRCQPRLTRIRRNLISLWSKKIQQPKHLVLTQKNFDVLTRKKIREHTKLLAKMRRTKCFAKVRGGCVSTEITNENRGWHLHAHLLLDVNWLEMDKVSITWGKLVGQEFAIVKVKDVRDEEYLQEICKYVVEGSELAKWQPHQINEFVQAVRGLRMFNSFGTLRELAPQIRAELNMAKPEMPPCKCGCTQFTYETEEASVAHDAEKLEHWRKTRAKHPERPASGKPAVGEADDTPSLL